MKTLWVLLAFFLFFIGCSDKNAFSRFNMSKVEELAADSILNSKIKEKGVVKGIVTVVYLNKVLPSSYSGDEYFYVYFYIKEKGGSNSFLLNGEKAISIKELPSKNKFTHLTSIETKWNRYYLVKFKKQDDILKFIFENDAAVSNVLIFEKDE